MSKLMENAQSVLQLVEEYGRNCAEFGCYGPALEDIRAAVQELEREAARYRRLRRGICPQADLPGILEFKGEYNPFLDLEIDAEIDKAIDAAMEQK